MTTLVELDLGNGASLLIEANDDVSVPRRSAPAGPLRRTGHIDSRVPFETLAATLRGFSDRAVATFREMDADVERVTLTFGVSLGGEVGVPYITKGRDAGALIVTLECRVDREKTGARG